MIFVLVIALKCSLALLKWRNICFTDLYIKTASSMFTSEQKQQHGGAYIHVTDTGCFFSAWHHALKLRHSK